MKVCKWCTGLIWPWQKRDRYGRWYLHRGCAQAVEKLTMHDEEVTGV